MTAIIIEDEKPALEKLKSGLHKANPDIEILACLTSIEQATSWLQSNTQPDLIFMDIELSDGLSFQILEQSSIQSPIIFTTAYDEYWQEAFEHNSIDYLLKPIKQEKLETALSKYHRLKEHFAGNLQNLLNWQKGNSAYKKKFLVKRGSDYISIKVEDIAYFYASHKVVCLVNNQSHKFILDESLSELEEQLDSSMFYRVNRKYLVNLNAIQRIRAYPKSKLQLDLLPAVEEEVLIAQENVSSFKDWMGK
jgi:two-component system, LytTR family, response regulator